MGIRVSKERIEEARKGDLYEFLKENYEDLFMQESGYLRMKSDRSVTIKMDFPGFCDHSGNNPKGSRGGNSIDFLVDYMGFSFTDAVIALTGDYIEDDIDDSDDEDDGMSMEEFNRRLQAIKERHMAEDTGNPDHSYDFDDEFEAPEKNADSKRLYANLIHIRCISADTVRDLVLKKYIYQDTSGNIVFISKDRDWAELRGTNQYADARCSKADGCGRFMLSDHEWCKHMDQCPAYKKSPFHGIARNSKKGGFWSFPADDRVPVERVYVCEAGVDAISLYELQRLQKSCVAGSVYCSIGGCGKHDAIKNIIDTYKEKVILAVDNDDAGVVCRERYPNVQYIIPVSKDWNDDLKMIYGRKG